MAAISIDVDGEVTFCAPVNQNNPCMSISTYKDVPNGYNGASIPVSRDVLYLHGSRESMRAFANGILLALDRAEARNDPQRAPSDTLTQGATEPASSTETPGYTEPRAGMCVHDRVQAGCSVCFSSDRGGE